MTLVTAAVPRVVIIGNGTRGPYSLVDSSGVAIRLVSTSHLRLTRYGASTDDNEDGSVLVENTDYTVGGTQDNRTFTLASTENVLTSSQRIVAERVQSYTQDLDLTTGGAFNAEAVESRFDKHGEFLQELKARLDRTVPLQFADGTSNVAFPSPPTSATQLLARLTTGAIAHVALSDVSPTALALGAGWSTVLALPSAGTLDNLAGIRFVATYAALTALTTATGLSDNSLYCTYGRTAEEDGGFGFWRYDSGSSATADGGTILAIDGGGAGRFFRQLDDAKVYPAWWGMREAAADTVNSAALASAYAYVLSTKNNHIVLPPGDLQVSDAWTIEPAVGTDFRSNILVSGQGGWHTDMGSRLYWTGTSGYFLTLLSCVNMHFSDLEIVAPHAAWDGLVKVNTKGADPYYSSFNVTFSRVRFALATSTTSNTKTLMQLANAGPMVFRDCTWQGARYCFQLGTPTADAENTGTFGGGVASQIEFNACYFAGDILHGRGGTVIYRNCYGDAVEAQSGRAMQFTPTGDQRMRNVHIDQCWWDYSTGGTGGVFYTEGSDETGLYVTGGRVGSHYTKGFVVDNASDFHNILFKSTANNFRGVDILATASDVSYSGLINECTGTTPTTVFDGRSFYDGTTTATRPFAINRIIPASPGDITVASGGSFADIISTTWVPHAGELDQRFTLTIVMGASAGQVTARLIYDAFHPRVAWRGYLQANETRIIEASRYGNWPGADGFTTQTVKVQVANDSANDLTVKADSALTPGVLQILEKW